MQGGHLYVLIELFTCWNGIKYPKMNATKKTVG